MRVQIHALLQTITEHYKSDQATSADSTTGTDGHAVAMNLFAESNSSNDSEIDCDDDDDVVIINNDHSSDGSGSEWSCGGDVLMQDDDEPLVYECSGEFITLFHSKHDVISESRHYY